MEHTQVKPKVTLHELATELAAVDLELDEELNGELEQELTRLLNTLTLKADTKIENISRWVLNLQAEEMVLAEEIERLHKRKKSAERKREALKQYLVWFLRQTGHVKWETPLVKLRVMAGKERIEVDENLAWNWPQEVFEKCCSQTVKVNKSTLKQLYAEQLDTLPGVCRVQGDDYLVMR